jgi:acyl-CoA thioesterase II
MSSPSWIARLVRLDDISDDGGPVFRTSNALGAGPRLFGGLIAAQALAAAGATVPSDRLPQSLHAYFIKGGRVGVDVVYTVEVTRDGRSFTTRRVTASQDGVPIFEMLASFHRPEETLDWQRPANPRLALAEATTVVAPPERWADYFEARVAPRPTPPEWPQQPFWFRSREPIEDDPLLRACAGWCTCRRTARSAPTRTRPTSSVGMSRTTRTTATAARRWRASEQFSPRSRQAISTPPW